MAVFSELWGSAPRNFVMQILNLVPDYIIVERTSLSPTPMKFLVITSAWMLHRYFTCMLLYDDPHI